MGWLHCARAQVSTQFLVLCGWRFSGWQQGCARLMSRCSTHESWVKFDSTLTQMSRVRVESAVKIKAMSRVRVESRWSSFESELSQLDNAWVKVESMIFRGENVKILQLSVFTEKEPTYSYIRPHPPPPGQQLFPKLGKTCWVVSQIWLNSDSNELSQSWVRLVNLGFELSRSWVRLANLGFELSRSWVTWVVIWVRVESARKNESSTTLVGSLAVGGLRAVFVWRSAGGLRLAVCVAHRLSHPPPPKF